MSDGITQLELQRLLHYAPETGAFTRLVRTSRRIKVGQVAGSSSPGDYIRIGLKGRRFLAHRLAWIYMTGQQPPVLVDHENGDRQDNRWSNLREATHSTNAQNMRRPRSDSTTGFLGVVCVGRGKFLAQLKGVDKSYTGTRRDDPALAHEDYVALKRQHHAGGML